MSDSLPSPEPRGGSRRLIVIAVVVVLFALVLVLVAWLIGGTPMDPFDYDL